MQVISCRLCTEIKVTTDQRAWGTAGFLDEMLDPSQAGVRGIGMCVGVDGADPARVARVPCPSEAPKLPRPAPRPR